MLTENQKIARLIIEGTPFETKVESLGSALSHYAPMVLFDPATDGLEPSRLPMLAEFFRKAADYCDKGDVPTHGMLEAFYYDSTGRKPWGQP